LHLWNLEGKFVCSYVGTIGMAHGLEVVLEAAKILKAKGRRDIAFCLVGDGASRERLQRLSQEWGLGDCVVFTGRQPREEIPYVLASTHACLIHLKRCALFSSVMPSKVFETMAMGRPIVMGVDGEAREIVLEARAGLPMEPDSPASLVKNVEKLADDPQLAVQLGRTAREAVAMHYDRNVLAARYLALLHRVAGIAHEVDSANVVELEDHRRHQEAIAPPSRKASAGRAEVHG
jgi:glycosyltransferase involved in cell wall biosynthesis